LKSIGVVPIIASILILGVIAFSPISFNESETLAYAQSCVTPPSGLVSWWPGDDNTDDIVNGHDGTLIDDATFDAGKVGQAFDLDGTDDFVEVDPYTGGSVFAFDLWFKPTLTIDKSSASNGLAQFHDGGVSIYEGMSLGPATSAVTDEVITLLHNGNNFQNHIPVGWGRTSVTDITLTAGTWYHLFINWNPGEVRYDIYLNGVKQTTTKGSAPTHAGLFQEADTVLIGKFFGSYFNGLIDEVEIFDAAVTESQIEAIFDADTAGKCKETHYLGYEVKDADDTEFEEIIVQLTDQFGSGVFEVEEPERLYNPVVKNDEGIFDETTHLVGYEIEAVDDEHDDIIAIVNVTNQFGFIILDVEEAELLLVPSNKTLGSPPEPFDSTLSNHYKCYEVEVTDDTPEFEKIQVNVTDTNFGEERMLEVEEPELLCNPVEKMHNGIIAEIIDPENHLLCYKVKPADGDQEHQKRNSVFTDNQFGPEEFETDKERELCVPSMKMVLQIPLDDDDDDDDDDDEDDEDDDEDETD